MITTIHSEGGTNVCIRFHGDLSCSSLDQSRKYVLRTHVSMSVCFHTWLTFRTVGASSSLSLFIAATGVSLKYGGSPSTISTTMIPIDQISTWCIIIPLNYAADLTVHVATVGIYATWEWSPLFLIVFLLTSVPYGDLEMTSGAIQ